MHKRKEIRAKIASMLSDSSVGGTVFNSRILPLALREFPAICVYSIEEPVEKSKDESNYTRRLRIVVAIYVRGNDEIENTGTGDSVDDQLDDFCSRIEAVLLTQYQTLDRLIYRLNLVSTKYEIEAGGDEIVGMGFMEWEAVYHDSTAA